MEQELEQICMRCGVDKAYAKKMERVCTPMGILKPHYKQHLWTLDGCNVWRDKVSGTCNVYTKEGELVEDEDSTIVH